MKPVSTELVPKTTGKMYKLNFIALDSMNVKQSIPPKLQNKPVVMEVRYRKKTKYVSVDSVKTLETLGMN
jgi:hypothetical protein